MTEKQTTDRLDLRAGPRPRIVRFRRGVVIGASALASGVLIGITMIALHGPIPRGPSEHPELYDTGKKPTADGLAALPGDYSPVKQQTPVLGPPLPGDLGMAIVAHQRESGANPSAEEQRLASQALHARESGVLFRVNNRPEATAAEPSKPATAATAATSQPQNDRLTLDPERDQNDQQRKLDFLHQRDATGIYIIPTPCKRRPRPLR